MTHDDKFLILLIFCYEMSICMHACHMLRVSSKIQKKKKFKLLFELDLKVTSIKNLILLLV